MKRSLHCHRAAGCSLWGGHELQFLSRHPGHAQEPCAGLFLSRAKERRGEKLMDWLSGSLPCFSAQKGFLPALEKAAENAVGVGGHAGGTGGSGHPSLANANTQQG